MIPQGGRMKTHLKLKMMAVFTAILCLSISTAWGAKRGPSFNGSDQTPSMEDRL
jgi:hypothetical protein